MGMGRKRQATKMKQRKNQKKLKVRIQKKIQASK